VTCHQFNQADRGPKVTENWVQKGQDAKGEGYEDRAKAAWVKFHAVSIHSASGGQWHPKGSVKKVASNVKQELGKPPHALNAEKAYANPQT
jgi:hypothetical protein